MPVSEVSSHQHVHLASRHKLNMLQFHRGTFHTRLSQSPAQRFGTHCMICCVIRPSSLNALGRTWKRISLPDIRDLSTLEVSQFHINALYNSTFTYLLPSYLNTKFYWTDHKYKFLKCYMPTVYMCTLYTAEWITLDKAVNVMYLLQVTLVLCQLGFMLLYKWFKFTWHLRVFCSRRRQDILHFLHTHKNKWINE